MARLITDIQNDIYAKIATDITLLNSVSQSAIYRRFIVVVSYAIWMLETLFDTHKSQIDTAIYEQKSGTPRWYRNMALAFQYGFDLLPDSDKFNNVGFTDDQISASKIIKYCSEKQALESNQFTIKVAGESGSLLIPLTISQKESFSAYMEEIKYAGVKLKIINNPADKLVLVMAIYRDVLVIDENGNSILNGGKPIETAIRAYMKALPFDGELVLNDLIANLRAVDGVNNANIINATSSYWDEATTLYTAYAPINVKTIPMSGYFELENFDNVTYVV